MPLSKRARTMLSVTMDPDVLKALRIHCVDTNQTISGVVEDAVVAMLKEKSK